MKNKLLLFILLIPVICLFIWNCYLWYNKDLGTEIKVVVTGYDPRDLLSGHYVTYRINWDKTDLTQFENKPFTKQDFIDSLNKKSLRFYVSERKAKNLNKILLYSTLDSKDKQQQSIVEVVYSYKKGKHPIAKTLLVNGKDYRKS